MDLTRRDFIKISESILTSLAVIGLSGCGVRENGNLSYDLLYDGNYKFIIYDNITNNEKAKKLRK